MSASPLETLKAELSPEDYAKLVQFCSCAEASSARGILIISNPERVFYMGLSEDVPPGVIHLVSGPSLLDPESP